MTEPHTQADHDLLIRMNEKLDGIADWIAEEKQAIAAQKVQCTAVQAACANKFTERVTQTLFRWTIGLIVIFLIGVGGGITSNMVSLSVLQKQMEQIVLPVIQQHMKISGTETGKDG